MKIDHVDMMVFSIVTFSVAWAIVSLCWIIRGIIKFNQKREQ